MDGDKSMDRERQIRERAYEIWQEEGTPEGREREHWDRASREIETERPRPPESDDTNETGTDQPAPSDEAAEPKSGSPAVARRPRKAAKEGTKPSQSKTRSKARKTPG